MSPVVALNPQIKHYPHRHTVALLRAMILTMIESYADGLQSPAVALMHSPLKRLVVPAVVIFTLAGMAGCGFDLLEQFDPLASRAIRGISITAPVVYIRDLNT
jgi:hypothetical protein